jgi:hypothetical protein
MGQDVTERSGIRANLYYLIPAKTPVHLHNTPVRVINFFSRMASRSFLKLSVSQLDNPVTLNQHTDPSAVFI